MANETLHLAINLNGHHWNAASESVRFSLFGAHAAPVTAAFMGYPGPSGAASIGYTYVDAHAVPPAHATHFSERLALLPHTYYLNYYARSHPSLRRPPPAAFDEFAFDRRNVHAHSKPRDEGSQPPLSHARTSRLLAARLTGRCAPAVTVV